MSASGLPNAQARKLLQTLGKFIVTLAKSVNTKDEKALDSLMLGVEATEFVTELEMFLSSSQQHKEERSMEVNILQPFNDPFCYLEGTDWFWESPYAGGEDSSSSSEADESSASFHGYYADSDSESEYVALHKQPSKTDIKSHDELMFLQRLITRDMPIHVLHFDFEPVGSKFKISLVDQNAIYEHLSKKLSVDCNTPEFHTSQWVYDHTRYAILSHTWNHVPGELTYTDWKSGQLDPQDPKCQKLINFCKTAYEKHGLAFGWIDTVCINKDNSSELDESIRSMYKWYSQAKVCITYLGTTVSLSDMAGDRWFTRGWTFQELVAPEFIKFYNKDWEQVIPSEDNDKQNASILKFIEAATKMTQTELENIGAVSISRRMELAARRRVTRKEDTAYSLMGIFGVSISTAYGEGEGRALFRLLKEIFDTNKDVSDIFNWGSCNFEGYSSITSLFPENLSDYTNRSKNPELRSWRPIEPLMLTHLGLRTPILLMAANLPSEINSANRHVGDYRATVHVPVLTPWRGKDLFHMFLTRDFTTAIGVLNVEEHNDGSSIRIRKTCFAVLLTQEQDGLNSLGMYQKQDTSKPIVFPLKKVGNANHSSSDYYVVRKHDLGKHGMKLVTLYL